MGKACRRKGFWLLWVPLGASFILTLVELPRAHAQVLYGFIVGHVTDPSGAAVPGATLTITNKATNQSRQAVTDQAGDYSIADLQTGSYALKVTREGFKTFERAEVPVMLNSATRVDIFLEVGAVTQTVEVTGAAAALQTETAEVHADVGAVELENLPVPLGRNYQQVYRALNGFSPPQNSHSIPTNPSRSLEFTVNGTSDNQNNTRIDGVSTYNVQLPHVTSYVPTLESVQEVNVVTDSFDAEQGFAGGAAINVQTRSGTNALHGALFEYNSNNHLKAWPDQFDAAGKNQGNKPKLVYNQFGGAVGGPIKRDKLFFFTSYEGTYDRRHAQKFFTVPTAAMKAGDFSATSKKVFDPLTGDPVTGVGRTQFVSTPAQNSRCAIPAGCPNMIPTARLDPVTLGLIAPLWPDPNVPGFKNNYFASAPFEFTRHQSDTRIQWLATPKMAINGTLGVLHYTSFTHQAFGDALGGPPVRAGSGTSNPGHGAGDTYRATGLVTYTFSPNFLMDAHFGYARQGTSSQQSRLNEQVGLNVLGIPGTNGTRKFEGGWPEFDFHDSFQGSADFATVGISNNFMPYYRHDPQMQAAANFNWIKGTHNIRFGTDMFRQALNHTQAEFLSGAYGSQGGFEFTRGITSSCLTFDAASNTCTSVSGNSRFNSFASFMLGLPDFVGKTFQVPDVYHIHAWLFSVYGRDRWNVTPKLTLNYGLRWEYLPVPGRPDRGIERFDLNTGMVQLCGFMSVPGDCGIQVSKKLFAPRLGVAYRATNSLVIRAGYGITNDPYEAMEFLRNNYPIMVVKNIQTPNDLFPVRRLDPSTPSSFASQPACNPTTGSFTVNCAGIDPISAPSLGNGIIPIPGDVAFGGLPKNYRRGYIQSWNFTLQKELGRDFIGQVGYVGNNSIRQLGFLDFNAGQIPGAGADGRLLKLLNPTLYANRNVATVFLVPVATGHYNSLQAQLTRRFTQGVQLTVNYTWAKAMNNTDNSDQSPGDEKIQAVAFLARNRSVIDSDHTHNLEIINIWQLPFGTGKRWLSDRGVASKIFSGWQVNSLASFISGPPFSVYADGTSLNMPGSNQTADQVKPHVAKLGNIQPSNPDCPSGINCSSAGSWYDPFAFAAVSGARFGSSGFNILRGPGIVNWDFGIFREFALNERWKLQFRAEAFNSTNTPHFDVPDNCVCDANATDPVTNVVTDPGPFMGISDVINLAREGVDERQFRFGLRLTF